MAIIGGVLRFWHLGRPPWLVFDETYYVKQGASMITFGYERAVRQGLDKPDVLWNAGTTDVWGERADFVVHPPAGKWLIGLGQLLFGSTEPVGWRFASAVVGTASILMLGRIARRLLGSTLLGTTVALLLAVDGQHFVHSRTGLLDVSVMFWALAGFGCLLVDRDQARARLAAGEGTWIRPRGLAAGAGLGMCTATKWSGLFFVAAFSIASLAWDVAARRASGRRHWLVPALFRDGVGAFVHLVPTVALSAQAGNRLAVLFLGHNDNCSGTIAKSNASCSSTDLDPANYCKTRPASFERELRKGLDTLMSIGSTRIGVVSRVRVSQLCNFGSKSNCQLVGSCSFLWGVVNICGSLTRDCSNTRIIDSYITLKAYRDILKTVTAEYAAIPDFGASPIVIVGGQTVGGGVKAAGTTFVHSDAPWYYRFNSSEISCSATVFIRPALARTYSAGC